MGYSKVNIDGLEDQAVKHGLRSQEARFPRRELGAEGIGLAHYRVKPGATIEFGHRHRSMEEAYVVLGGSGEMKVDDDVVPLAVHDVVYVQPSSWRAWRAGDDGLVLLALGTHVEGDGESEMQMGWWS
jgi:mannose-6-phosphate isomerase-like protein (cupin superfamily)